MALGAAVVGTAWAGPAGEAGLRLLSRLQSGEWSAADVLNESVLSPHCGEARKAAIERRIEDLARRLRENDYQFALLDEKVEGQFAAVLVSGESKEDPLEVEVFALGFGRQEESWKPTPSPASFDNVEMSFDQALRGQVSALEIWMGAERVRRLLALQLTVDRRYREQLAQAVPDALLNGANPRQHVKAFLEACADRNVAAVMRFIGEFESGLSEDDRQLQRTVSRGLRGRDRRGHWRLLTSKEVIQVIVQEDRGDDLDAEVLVLAFDPRSSDPVNLLRFVLLKVGKRWELELPESLRLADASRMEFQRAIWQENHSDDDELRNRFEEFFEEQWQPHRSADLREAGEQITQVLRDGTLADLFRWLHRSDDLSDSERRSAFRYLADFWTSFHIVGETSADGELVEVLEGKSTGLLAFHLISPSKLESVSLSPLVMVKGEEGWGIAPGVTTSGNYVAQDQSERDELDRIIADFLEQKAELEKRAANRFLSRFVTAVPKAGESVGEEEASKLVMDFRQQLREGKLLDAFESCALLDSEEGAWEALKNLSYELRGIQKNLGPDQLLKVASQKHWTGVSLRLDGGPESDPIYPMYLVVATGEGPRIVVDVPLRLATNTGRQVLNKRVWKRVEGQLEESETALVQSLFEGHVEISKNDLDAWGVKNK